MRKIPALLGLAVFITALLISASNASAKFVSDNGHTSGPLQIKTGTITVFTIGPIFNLQYVMKCSSFENAVWKIRKSESSQGEVLEGGHENITGTLKGCVTTIAGETKAGTVNSSCTRQAVQTGTNEFTEGIVSDCSLTAGGCVITLAASPANSGLKAVTAVNIESHNLEIRSSISGLIASPNEKCKTLGVTETTGGFFATEIAREQKVE